MYEDVTEINIALNQRIVKQKRRFKQKLNIKHYARYIVT